jgi:hypothetical protein
LRFLVVVQHRGTPTQPIRFAQGSIITISKKFKSDRGEDYWYFCSTPDSLTGWVPEEIIEQLALGSGKALEDFSALELNVDTGDVLIGSRTLNGWLWCHRPSETRRGWVPLKNLRRTDHD